MYQQQKTICGSKKSKENYLAQYLQQTNPKKFCAR